jgi:hypothetical protein
VPMSMPGLARTSCPMTDLRPARGLLDTSVVIDLEQIEPSRLPVEVAVSALTMAELAAGPHATSDPEERALRQDRLQRAAAAVDPLPFDAEARLRGPRQDPPGGPDDLALAGQPSCRLHKPDLTKTVRRRPTDAARTFTFEGLATAVVLTFDSRSTPCYP